jgi:hypothetical protein
MAERNARKWISAAAVGWSPEFSAWCDERGSAVSKARDFLNEEATTEESTKRFRTTGSGMTELSKPAVKKRNDGRCNICLR